MRCDKCGGLVVHLHDESYCYNCSKRFMPPNEMPVDNANLRWESTLCGKCHERKAVRGRELCRVCAMRKVCHMTALLLALAVLTGCSAPTKYYADIQVYDDIKWGILHQIDGAKCKHIGFVLTDSPHMKDFEMKLRCSLREVP